MQDYILLSLFTGARRSNVLGMRWDQVDLAGRTWRIPRTKAGRSQVIPLEDAEIAILERRRSDAGGSVFVFPSESASGHRTSVYIGWSCILAKAGIKDLRIRDLRRSLGSWMADTGASLPMIGHALDHSSPRSTMIYARLSLDPMREAKRRAIGVLQDAGNAG